MADAYEDIVFIFQSFVQQNDYDETPGGYLKAAEDLRDHSFPDWPLAGMPFDSSCLPQREDVSRSIARGVGIYVSVALEELTGRGKLGAERIDDFLENSGLLTSDVRE